MSASPSIDAYDAQMLDFSLDPDVPMNITGSAEFFAETLMDHDGHLTTSTYAEHASVEVDMEEYVGDNEEYEMADETAEYQRLHGDELLDIEVYDASHAPSPLVPPQPLQQSADVAIDSEHPAPTSPSFSEHATLPEVQGELESGVHPVPLDHPVADSPHVEPSASGEGVSSGAVSSNITHPTDAPDESIHLVSESHEQLGDTARTNEQPFEIPVLADAHDEAEPHVPPVSEEHPANSEPPTAESAPLASAENAYDSGPPVQDEKATEQALVTEGETADPLHISDGVYIDPPPAVLLSLADLSKPELSLFNQPDVEDESTEESHSNQKGYSLLLENRPTLYYEPLSSVFEALRRDEGLLSRVPHSFEGELVLDAYDLQLAISEDNVHSREISLHDLNILHDGSDFVGPLRLLLRAIVPRFVIRYYALQEQLQRLNAAAETGEGEHDEEHHEHYDTGEEQPQPQQEEAANHPSTHATVTSEGLEAPPTTEAEELAKESVLPPESTEKTPQENYESEDASGVQEPAAEYHEVTGEATLTLENEDDYEGTEAGGEDESTKSERLDADQVHDTAAGDTDAAARVSGQEPEFGGEQTEYSDYVQPEEYDERYGGDLPEQAGGASLIQYGEPPHYEEEGEQDTSTAVDETQTIFPGSDEDEVDKSTATPTPARAVVLETESSDFVDDNATNESISAKQENSVPSTEEFATSESTNGVVHSEYTSRAVQYAWSDDTLVEQASGNQETSVAQAKVFSEVDESDSNFISMLEREAGMILSMITRAFAYKYNVDAEFDRTFNPEQSGQEGSIEATIQHDETWDEWDDEDAEGEDEEDWIDPDAASNESSVTLSSKASSKRSYEEIDPSEEVYVEDLRNSPGTSCAFLPASCVKYL
ncbi:hypothetical protein J3R83DRAFT_1633 [Lanmaoa asiatica]|nr:hypothetical protein J3R83DRAFT_1633 [Lanmaoa asiatica]